MAEYYEQFISLASPLTNILEDVLLTSFIKGLKPLIRVELRLWDLESIEMAMEWALKIEEKYVAHLEHPYFDPFSPYTPTTRHINKPTTYCSG